MELLNITATLSAVVLVGYFVALSTGWILGKPRSRQLPGGSMVSGFIAGVASHDIWICLLYAVLGLTGWILYRSINED